MNAQYFIKGEHLATYTHLAMRRTVHPECATEYSNNLHQPSLPNFKNSFSGWTRNLIMLKEKQSGRLNRSTERWPVASACFWCLTHTNNRNKCLVLCCSKSNKMRTVLTKFKTEKPFYSQQSIQDNANRDTSLAGMCIWQYYIISIIFK